MGNYISFIQVVFFPVPAPKWGVSDIPDLTGKVAIVTGGNAGCGLETVKALLNKNAKVYVVGRSKEKCEAAISALKQETGKEAHFLQMDLADLASVRRAAAAFLESESTLHILIHNAGVMNLPVDQLTAEGYDMQFGVHVIAPYLLSVLLHSALKLGAPSAPNGKSRVVHLSSSAAYLNNLDFATFVDGPLRRKQDTAALYCQSKFGNLVLAQEMSRRWAADGIVSHGVHPGVIKSDLWNHTEKGTISFMYKFAYDPPYGALNSLYAATAPAAAQAKNKWYVPWTRERALPNGVDEATGRRLWDWLDKEVTAKGL